VIAVGVKLRDVLERDIGHGGSSTERNGTRRNAD
jgi:hypothetical protein